jgi:hypothetical protein
MNSFLIKSHVSIENNVPKKKSNKWHPFELSQYGNAFSTLGVQLLA